MRKQVYQLRKSNDSKVLKDKICTNIPAPNCDFIHNYKIGTSNADLSFQNQSLIKS